MHARTHRRITASPVTPARFSARHSRLFLIASATVALLGLAPHVSRAATLCVDNTVLCSDATSDSCGLGPPYCTIQAAITAAVSGADTINVAAGGTYPENVILNKDLVLNGGQAGVDACGRVATETTIAPVGGIGIELLLTAAGSVIDGFTITAPVNGIESNTGSIARLEILNNRILGFTTSGIFLDDPGIDITVHQNLVDGSSKPGGGGLVHFDTDPFHGLHLTDNCIVNGVNGTGFFVDGNHNVNPSTGTCVGGANDTAACAAPSVCPGGTCSGRQPLISGNLIDKNGTGMNLGSRAFGGSAAAGNATISDNIFSNNTFDGLQGGIQRTDITGNLFSTNGRFGLSLTSFGSTAADRGGQNDAITLNCALDNGVGKPPPTCVGGTNAGASCQVNSECPGGSCVYNGAGFFFSAGQAAGTISTNVANNNNIQGNQTGAAHPGTTETINAESNWWGCPTGANTAGCDTASPNVDTNPFLAAPQPGTICDASLSTPTPNVTPTATPTPTDPATPTLTATPTPTATLTATPTPTPTLTIPLPTLTIPLPTATATAVPLNHFQCYEVHHGPFSRPGVSLDDAFGPGTVDVGKPKRFCAPADKNDEDPTAPQDPDHLAGYKIKQRTPAFAKLRDQVVVNQFGTLIVDVLKPELLLVPSAKDLSGPPPPLNPAVVNHFKCHKVRGKFRRSGIKVDDQFTGTLTVDIIKPVGLCVRADKNGEGIIDPSDALMCYRVRRPFAPPPGTVFVNNQFEVGPFDVFRPTELCVPSQVNPGPQPTPTPISTLTPTPIQTPSLQCCGPFDQCIDTDGTASAGDGIPGAVEVLIGNPLTPFPAVPNNSGLDMFDNDGNAAWTFGPAGDDLHAEGPTFCPTAIRNGVHDLGLDCKVLDLDGSLFNGQPVNCDLENGAFCMFPLPTPIEFHDTNLNGAWDDGEDIVLDMNGNGICD